VITFLFYLLGVLTFPTLMAIGVIILKFYPRYSNTYFAVLEMVINLLSKIMLVVVTYAAVPCLLAYLLIKILGG
jgi:hypothetical protein